MYCPVCGVNKEATTSSIQRLLEEIRILRAQVELLTNKHTEESFKAWIALQK